MILATDLDGTFLGGTEEKRRELYELIKAHSLDLIYVSGRGLETILPLLSDTTLPVPRFIIADVGATVVDGRTLESVQPIQEEIFQVWPGTAEVESAMRTFSRWKRQAVPQERRCSYELENPEGLEEIELLARQLGCSVIFSAGKYLDILPRGVSKGHTLASLLELMDMDSDRVLVAGDTLNDLTMFQLGLKGVVVGGSEPDLVRALQGTEDIFLAQSPGAGGILQAIEYFDLLKEKSAPRVAVPSKDGASELVVVYHRLPYDEVEIDGRRQFETPKSPNGIIPTLLGLFRNGRPGAWVAWCQRPTRETSPQLPDYIDRESFPGLKIAPISLRKRDIDIFYKIFSKEAFWPVIFSFPSKVVFNEEHWNIFCEVNRLFAQRTAEEASLGATVWIHDYNLWMVPAYLRALRSDLKISFFHHTSFPAPDIFNILPWRRQIIGSLLQCDYIGFHIPSYAENFANVVRSNAPSRTLRKVKCAPRFSTYGCALGIDEYTTAVEVADRNISIGVHPVGIDLNIIEKTVHAEATKARIVRIKSDLGGKKAILSVERLDYVKGPLEKLEAFERFLEQNPELHEKIVFVNICTPPGPEVEVYNSVRVQIDEAVGRINGRFSRMGWIPIVYFFRSLSFEEVVAYYAASTVAWITPLRDGLNLVAKEFVAVKSMTDKDGVLILSEFAGAAVELFGALLTNPYDPVDMVQTLKKALGLSPLERRSRLRRLTSIVRNNDISRWCSEFLEGVRSAETAESLSTQPRRAK